MEDYAYLLIIAKDKPNINHSVDYIYINSDFSFIDDSHILINEKTIEFCYLIYSNKINVTYPTDEFIMKEFDKPLTNWIYQTSIENIYYINEDKLDEAVNEIIEA